MILINQVKLKLSEGLFAFHSPHTNTMSKSSVFGIFMNTNFLFPFQPRLILFPSPSCQAVSHAYWLEFKLRKYNSRSNSGLVLHAPKHEFKAFSGSAFFNCGIVLHDIDKMTCYPSHCYGYYSLFTNKSLSMLTILLQLQY